VRQASTLACGGSVCHPKRERKKDLLATAEFLLQLDAVADAVISLKPITADNLPCLLMYKTG